MVIDTEQEIEKIFISYKRILYKLQLLNIKTKSNKRITHKDLRQAIDVMNKKHPTCRWKGQKSKGYKHYIVTEGFYWLVDVYFQKDKSVIEADIDFFNFRIKLYEEFLKVKPKELWSRDMYVYELNQYFNRASETIRRAINKMVKANKNNRYIENGKYKISKKGIEWLCKNCFKTKYLELLEEYKMELTEQYIAAGYPYDIFL